MTRNIYRHDPSVDCNHRRRRGPVRNGESAAGLEIALVSSEEAGLVDR